MMGLDEIEPLLQHPPNQPYDQNVLDNIRTELATLKRASVNAGNQDRAKEIWRLEEVLSSQQSYFNAFNKMKSGEYYDAWCTLERAEISLESLDHHYEIKPGDPYALDIISKHVQQFQSLFPYKIFLSPEFVIHEKKCSICNQIITLRNPCGHRTGDIYDGEMRIVIITKADIIATALVKSPVQKYSVPFITDQVTGESQDHYNYGAVNYVIERLNTPFVKWDYTLTTKTHPHSRFRDVGRNDPCPCGSGNKYKKCCLKKEGVTMRHCDVKFDAPLPAAKLGVEFF